MVCSQSHREEKQQTAGEFENGSFTWTLKSYDEKIEHGKRGKIERERFGKFEKNKMVETTKAGRRAANY